MQSINPIRPNAIIANMHTSTTRSSYSSSQPTSLQFTGQMPQPQANTVALSGRHTVVSASVATQRPESATARFYKTKDKAVLTESVEVNLCEVCEYYPMQTERVFVPEPLLKKDASDDSFVPESTTEILWHVSV